MRAIESKPQSKKKKRSQTSIECLDMQNHACFVIHTPPLLLDSTWSPNALILSFSDATGGQEHQYIS